MTQTKKGVTIELKSGDGVPEGSFKAIFSQFNVIDHDGDVTLPGAFQKGAKVPLAGVGHNWDIPTIGFGVINYDNEKAWIDGQFNLKMASAREHYESVKFAHENGVKQEYSYAYDVNNRDSKSARELSDWPGAKRVLKELDVKEVSQVLLGAGIGTGTVDVKGRKTNNGGKWPEGDNESCPICGDSLASHGEGILAVHKATYGNVMKGLSKIKVKEMSQEDRREAIQDAVTTADKIEDISAGEDPGWGGPWIVSTYPDYVIVRDDDGDGYLKIPYTIDDEGNVELGESAPVEQIWAEKSMDTAQLKFVDHANRVLVALRGYVNRSKSLADIRMKAGRQFSAANRQRIADITDAARAAVSEMEALLADTDTDGKARKLFLMKARAELGEMALHLQLPQN